MKSAMSHDKLNFTVWTKNEEDRSYDFYRSERASVEYEPEEHVDSASSRRQYLRLRNMFDFSDKMHLFPSKRKTVSKIPHDK